MKLHVLASYDVIAYYFSYPLLSFRRRWQELDYDIRFFTRPMDSLFACDVLLIDNRFFTPLWQTQRQRALDLLADFRRRCVGTKIIWLDITDSSGATQFQVLPFVDKYLKKQLLKDRTLYQKNFYGARIYTDYYQKRFNLPAEEVFSVDPLPASSASKLAVSWNLGLGPCFRSLQSNNWQRRVPFGLKQFLPHRYRAQFCQNRKRPQDVCFRGSERYNNRAIAYQRLEVIKKLRDKGVATALVSIPVYIHELKSTKIGVSPFGAGEICFRDFEIILNGGMLLKPDMSHIETWPDLFVARETYGAFCWDFSDFDERLEYYLKHEEERVRITTEAQRRYQQLFTREGQEDFCQRFMRLVKI